MGQRGGLGGLPIPLVVLCSGDMQSTQLLISTSCFFSWLLRSGSWVFLVFLSLVVHNLPQLGVHAFTVIFLLDIYLKKRKILLQRDIGTPMFIAALFKIAKIGASLVAQMVKKLPAVQKTWV